jgi:NAD(P)-dependent dehydrogenase (short-subunit alcohol dehydrogenase family)
MSAVPADLSGLAALVTGCGRARGIGRAVALTLAAAGADVAVTDVAASGVRNAGEPEPAGTDGLEALADQIKQLGGRAIALTGDVADAADKVGYPERAVYCASKFAVIGLTQAMAQELAPRGITVNAVCPGAVATDRNAATRHRAATTGDAAADNASSSPVGRIGEPDDIARAVLYLIDPAASYVTGQSLVVDGGRYMN